MKISPKALIKKNPFILAPMDDVTDIAFRELCEENGASYSTSELTSVDALIRDKVFKSRYERGNLKINSVQLFGSKPEVFVEAAKKVGDEADSIDVNFGCPSACVTGNDAGSMLLKDPKNVGAIIEKLVKNIDKPITAKIRLGYSKTTYLEVAKEVEDAGAELLAVHGRTAKQKYSGQANWDSIKEIYEQSRIPIVGNGDIRTTKDIDNYLGTHADALMIGRAAIGNPRIFNDFNQYVKTKITKEYTNDASQERSESEGLGIYDSLKRKQIQKKLFSEYIKKLERYDFYNINLKVQRQAAWFFKGVEGVKELRVNLQKTKDIDEILKLVEEF